MLPNKICFVDIETTGGRSFYDRIIEIGILRVEDNKLTKTYHSLINPHAHIPKEIELLTGITADILEDAPTFGHIKTDILEILEDCHFVAHNVRFDYGFLKQEFRRENMSFSSKHFCTVRLSRALFPEFRHHNLDAIIERFNFECVNRHRALDDAKILFDFYQKIQNDFSPEKLEEGLAKTMKKPSLPPKLPYSSLENLPEQPGVYLFYSESGMPLYIGKSKNIRERILSHFSSDIHSSTEMSISQQVTSIETVTTAGELGALLLESQLIKKLLPLYNRRSRIKRELIAIKSRLNSDGYQEAYLEPITTSIPIQFGADSEALKSFHGFFRSRSQAKAVLTEISKKNGICEKMLGLEKTRGECFAYRLEQCKGACKGLERPITHNLRFLAAFAQFRILPWPFHGAISICEKGIDGDEEYFVIDNWCYMGHITIDEYGQKKDDMISDASFDLETYKLIRQFIRNPNNRNRISLINKNNNELHSYIS